MSEEFTTGPWKTRKRANQTGLKRLMVIGGRGNMILADVACGHISDEENLANAHLIAAAPELYMMLDRLLSELPTKRDWLDPDTEALARAALAKARGEA